MAELFPLKECSFDCIVSILIHKYSGPSVARTLMARLPGLFRTHS